MSVQDSFPSQLKRLARWWGWLWLATLALALMFSLRYYHAVELDNSAAALAFRALMLIAHFGVVCVLLLIPVLLAALLCPRPRLILPLGAIVATLVLLLLLIDTQIYQLYRFHFNAGVVNLLFGGAARATFIFSEAIYGQGALIALAVLTTVGVLTVLIWRAVQRTAGSAMRARSLGGGMALVVVAFHLTHAAADALAYEPVLEQTDVLPLRYAATAKRFLRRRGVEVRTRPSIAVQAKTERSLLSYPLRPLQCRTPQPPYNIVFVLVDSWRFDEMNAEVTPHTARFEQRAVRFTDHYSGGNATRIGVFSLFYSIPGTYWRRMLNERQSPVFVQQLLDSGYDVRAFRSAPLYSPEFDRTIFAELPAPRLRSDGAGPVDWDADLTHDFIEFLDARPPDQPFFALLFYGAPHSFQSPPDRPQRFAPAAPDKNYLQLHSGADKLPLLNRYRNSLHYVDSLIGTALRALEDRGQLHNSVVIVTSDHGEEFNDNGQNYWGHGSNYTRYQTGVPFLLYAPDLAPGVVAHRTTHFDVAPTLLSRYLGCETAAWTYSVGQSLFEPSGRETLVLSEYSNYAIVHGERIAVVRENGLQVFGPLYRRVNADLEPVALRSALEQNTRFYKVGGARAASR